MAARRRRSDFSNLTEAEKNKARTESKKRYKAAECSIDIRGCSERWNVCKNVNGFTTNRDTADFLLCCWEDSSDRTAQLCQDDLVEDVSGNRKPLCSSDALKKFHKLLTNLQHSDLKQFRGQALKVLNSFILSVFGPLQPTGEDRAEDGDATTEGASDKTCSSVIDSRVENPLNPQSRQQVLKQLSRVEVTEKNRFLNIGDVKLVNVKRKEGARSSDHQRVELSLSGVLKPSADTGTGRGTAGPKVLAKEAHNPCSISTINVEHDVKFNIKHEDIVEDDPIYSRTSGTLQTSAASGMGTGSGVVVVTYMDSLVPSARMADTSDGGGTRDQADRQTRDQAVECKVKIEEGLLPESFYPNERKRKPKTDCDYDRIPDDSSEDDLSSEVSTTSRKKKKAKTGDDEDWLPDGNNSDPRIDKEEESRELKKKKQKGSGGNVKSSESRKRPQEQEIRCDACDEMFPSRVLFKEHKKAAHGRTYECSECRKKLATRWSLSKHMAQHTGKAVLCQYCGKQFFSHGELRTHVNAKHFLTRQACDLCPKTFAGKPGLTFHVRMCHSGKCPDFLCATCGKSFPRKDHLARHNLTHTGVRKFHCELCGAAFNQKSNLTVHLRSHERNQEYIKKWFSCSVCGLKCGNKRGLETHMNSHD